MSTTLSPDVTAATRERELTRLPKRVLADMHVRHGGQMGRAVYLQWRKDELVRAVLEDEGIDPWAR